MSGEELKKKLKIYGFTIAEVAKRLGYDTDQRLHSALKSSDIKTGLLESVAKVANRSVGSFYETNISHNNQNSHRSISISDTKHDEIVSIPREIYDILLIKDRGNSKEASYMLGESQVTYGQNLHETIKDLRNALSDKDEIISLLKKEIVGLKREDAQVEDNVECADVG